MIPQIHEGPGKPNPNQKQTRRRRPNPNQKQTRRRRRRRQQTLRRKKLKEEEEEEEEESGAYIQIDLVWGCVFGLVEICGVCCCNLWSLVGWLVGGLFLCMFVCN
jgi:hypothetical protein